MLDFQENVFPLNLAADTDRPTPLLKYLKKYVNGNKLISVCIWFSGLIL